VKKRFGTGLIFGASAYAIAWAAGASALWSTVAGVAAAALAYALTDH
jgi:hypothetical protein